MGAAPKTPNIYIYYIYGCHFLFVVISHPKHLIYMNIIYMNILAFHKSISFTSCMTLLTLLKKKKKTNLRALVILSCAAFAHVQNSRLC